MKRALIVIASIASCLLLVSSASAFPPVTWHNGDEVAVLGHSFDEEYWTNESIEAKSPAGDNVTFSASYVNYSGVQAFLLALNMVENANGTGLVPFQMFGMHYKTPEKRDVFISSVLACLMVFNDTYNGTGAGSNNLPDPGHEPILYVFPFAAAKAVNNLTYVPVANVLPVQKLGIGHYSFGIQYLNMYAFLSGNPATIAFFTGFVVKFSELTVKYDVTIDNVTGEAKVKTSYTIGQVTELWGFLLGIPFKLDPRKDIDQNLGLSVVHFVTVFTSKYQGVSGNTSGASFNPNVTKLVNEDLLLKVGDNSERAMKISTHGTFDMINETSGATVQSNKTAFGAVVSAKLVDLWLVAWQLGFAGGAMSIFAYGLSDYVQSKYTGPKDLMDRSLALNNSQGFYAKPFWYAVSFPHWEGYKVLNDPTYTAYTSAGTQEQPPVFNFAIIIALALIIIPVVIVIAVVMATRKNKGT